MRHNFSNYDHTPKSFTYTFDRGHSHINRAQNTQHKSDSKQIYFVICILQLELWELKYHILACELLVDTSKGLNLKKERQISHLYTSTIIEL